MMSVTASLVRSSTLQHDDVEHAMDASTRTRTHRPCQGVTGSRVLKGRRALRRAVGEKGIGGQQCARLLYSCAQDSMREGGGVMLRRIERVAMLRRLEHTGKVSTR
jgi:hypothetical protein